MESAERIVIMRDRLQNAFSPDVLDIIDDSEKHRGHEGSRDGAGHYTLKISAPSLRAKSRVAAHREIYALLADLIPTEIHALQIIIL
ncbi:MAG: BolA family transcriptional regulator [Gammaproteobacteria bacterium]|nr:BolA family transcriptional regulator [Gammaproteobacteria bacterium]